jgi:hypothetical protein
MKRTVATTLVTAVPLSALLWLSGAVPFHFALGGVTLVVFFVTLSGFLALRAFKLSDLPAPAAWVAGVFASGLAVYALVAALNLLAATAFAVWASITVAWAFLSRHGEDSSDWQGLAGLGLCALATVMLCRGIAAAPVTVEREGVLFAWTDYFVHGGIISQFGDPLAVRESVFLADQKPLLYHYASYMLPAALAGLLDQPGFPLATSFWLPVGVLTMCAGAYVLGTTLAGAAGGVASVAVLTLVPDASNYWLRNGFLSFHFHMLVGAGADHVIGLFLLCAAALSRWVPGASARPLVASALLALGAVWFRVQVFATGFPAWFATAAMASPAVRARQRLFWTGTSLAFILFVVAFYTLTDNDYALHIFLRVVHDQQEPTAYDGLYLYVRDVAGQGPAIVLGLLLMYGATLGAFVVLYPLAVWVAYRARALRAIDAFPAFALLAYLAVMLTAPIDKGRDSTEFTVRPFVLVYAAVAIWTVCLLCRTFALRWPNRARLAWPTLLGATLVGVSLAWHDALAAALPKFEWGWDFYPTRVEQGLPQAARYLREHGRPGDMFAMRGLSLKWAATDPALQLIALTGMPAYLSYVSAHIIEGRDRERVALLRYAALARIDRAPSTTDALTALRRLGIAWYVVPGWQGPPWDRARREAAFVERDMAIYAVARR